MTHWIHAWPLLHIIFISFSFFLNVKLLGLTVRFLIITIYYRLRTAIDVDRKAYEEVGLPAIKRAGVEHKIDFIESPAPAVLDNLAEDVSISSLHVYCCAVLLPFFFTKFLK